MKDEKGWFYVSAIFLTGTIYFWVFQMSLGEAFNIPFELSTAIIRSPILILVLLTCLISLMFFFIRVHRGKRLFYVMVLLTMTATPYIILSLIT